MNLPEISIRKPVFAWMIMAALILFGYICFKQMGISQLPDVDFPVVSIAINYDGAAPEVMETDVVDVIEDAVMTVEGVRNVVSYSRFGNATVTLEFDLSRNIDAALQEVQTKIAQSQKMLPKEMDPPIITKTNPEDQPILWLNLSSTKHTLPQIMRYVRDELKDQFSTVSGVGEVVLGGYVDPNLRVWVSNKKLTNYSLTVDDVLNTISHQHSELPAGQIETSRREIDVRTFGEAKSLPEFNDLVINSRGGMPNYRPIFLKQVANVEEGLADIRRISRFNQRPAVGIGIRKQRGSNAVEVARLVKAKMEALKSRLPDGMEVNLVFDTTKFIEDSVGELVFTLILSALLTALVCWAFLGSWSSTMNVLMAIPTSIVGSFMILKAAGFTLNTFTLLGLSLAIGIVVDDAIMVLENIVRHREHGKSRVLAALDGSEEITFAAIAASVAIIAIFLPVAFMRGVIGRFFFQFGITMTAAVALSLLEALTLTPMRCSQFVDVGERTTKFGKWIESAFHWMEKLYRRSLEAALRKRWTVIGVSLAVFLLSVFSVRFINKEFVPSQDQSVFLLNIKTPPDSSMAYTDARVREIEDFLSKRPEVERYYSAVGGFQGGIVNTATVFVTMKDPGHRGRSPEFKGKEPTQLDFMGFCRKALSKIKDTQVFIQDLSMRGFAASRGYPVEFSVRGPDWDKLADYSFKVMDKMKATGLMTDVDTDYQLGKPEVRIIPDRTKAALRGVDVLTISETVNALIGGVVTGKYQIGGHRYDIRTRLMEDERSQADQIRDLWVRNNRGELVPLSSLVTLEEKPSLQQIARYDRERAVTIMANVATGKSQAAALDAVQKIAKETLPEGYHVVMSGSTQTFKESFQDLFIALILGVIVAYMVLASQFNSFIDPVTVLIALPFSVTGAFVALLATGQSLNIYSFIGLILLMGIVKKNSILLVDFTNQVRDGGEKDIKAALLKACPTRLRPIMMTSIATIAGAIPPALAIGPGAETRVPMALTVIGGVLVSTVLSLVVVPCVYSVFSRERIKITEGLQEATSHA